jgi:hypothetical protein
MNRYLVVMVAVVTAAIVTAGSAWFPASASSLDVRAARLQAESHNIAMCDDSVTITRQPTILGILDVVQVSNISPACEGHQLKVVIRTILGVTFERAINVDGTSETLSFLDLNLPLVNLLGTTYFVFDTP